MTRAAPSEVMGAQFRPQVARSDGWPRLDAWNAREKMDGKTCIESYWGVQSYRGHIETVAPGRECRSEWFMEYVEKGSET